MLEHFQPGLKPGEKPAGYNFWTCIICHGHGIQIGTKIPCPFNEQHFLDSIRNDRLVTLNETAPPQPLRLPEIIRILAEWEDKNGTISAITPHEWLALMEPIAHAAVFQSPRMIRATYERPKVLNPGPNNPFPDGNF